MRSKRFKNTCTILMATALIATTSYLFVPHNTYKKASAATQTTELGYDRKDIVESLHKGTVIKNTSTKKYKDETTANPLSSNLFVADPTSIEYNGRLYVYGTSDQDEYEAVGANSENGYSHIYSLEMFSTDDMVNWTYHGKIDTKKIAPWIYNSWAPSIVSKKHADGLTHFYLYFSNNGCGVGVLEATNPLGPWNDPLGKPLVTFGQKGLEDCPNPFDPGAVIDDKGDAYLTFGGGNYHGYRTKTSKIAKLNPDMISFATDYIGIETPYFFEANELNFINGTYVYTFNTNWEERSQWDYKGVSAPHKCAMAYMTSKTPLDPDSWVYRGEYLLNPGDSGENMDYGNNHSHLQEYKGNWYVFNHTMILKQSMGYTGGFRSLGVEKINVNEDTLELPVTKASRKGVAQIKDLTPFLRNSGSTIFTSAEIGYEQYKQGDMAVKSLNNGSWTYLQGVDFEKAPTEFLARVKGSGKLEVRLDRLDSEAVASIEFSSSDWKVVRNDVTEAITGKHNMYLVFSDANLVLESWQFTDGTNPSVTDDPIISGPIDTASPSNPTPTPKVPDSKLIDVKTTTTMENGISQTYSITPQNGGSFDLSKLKIRYRYAKAGNMAQQFWCDSAAIESNTAPYYSNITSEVSGTLGKGFVEIGFTKARQLAQGSLTMRTRVNQEDWSAYREFEEKGIDIIYDGTVIKTIQ